MTGERNIPSSHILGLWCLLGIAPAFAQQQPSPLPPTWPAISDRGVVAGRTFDISDIENISIETGNSFFTIPLASLPPGPGGSSYSVGLVYNSQIYEADQGSSITSPDGTAAAVPIILGGAYGGSWSYSFQYTLRYEQKTFPNGWTSCSDLNWHRLTVIFPDGSQHLLHGLGYNSDSYGYFNVSPFGYQAGCTGQSPVNGPLIYYTDDGSFARLELQPSSGAWVLYKSDGSKVIGSGVTNPQVSQIVDRNGNAVTFTHAMPGGTPAVTIADAAGRTITISSYLTPLGASSQTVTGPGANGQTLTWSVNWGTWSSSHSFSYQCVDDNRFNNCKICYDPNGTNGCNSSLISGGITSIILPKAQETDGTLQYQFTYNSNDTDQGRGELKSVTTPLGATATYSYANPYLRPLSGDINNPVSGKTLTYKDATGQSRSESWTYGQWSGWGTNSTKTVTYPDGGQRTYYEYDLAGDTSNAQPTGSPMAHRVGAIVEPNGDRTDESGAGTAHIRFGTIRPAIPT